MPDTFIPELDRSHRHRPTSGLQTQPVEQTRTFSGPLHLVAPTLTQHQNTLQFSTWIEAKIVNDRGKPLAGERCLLWLADGSHREKETDKSGIVRFDGLPILLNVNYDINDVYAPALQLPNVLEEWNLLSPDTFAKPESYRESDGMVHFVPVETPQYEIQVNHLTSEEKFQHFRFAYELNNAEYKAASPRKYNLAQKRWDWGKGAVCNQHVNFFLAYWFNYNANFTTSASQTEMTCLPLYSSDLHTFFVGANHVKHRGFSEFLDPVAGFGTKISAGPVPEPNHCNKAFRVVEYIRVSKYFDYDTKEPNSDGQKLIDALEDYNVYSVVDLKGTPAQNKAIEAVKSWLIKNMTKPESGMDEITDEDVDSKEKIKALTKEEVWSMVWRLDESNDYQKQLLTTLRKFLDPFYDHHCGLLLRRAPGGGPPVKAPYELWTFTADSWGNPKRIRFKKLADADLIKRKFFHIGIWKLKPLRKGGYASAEAEKNEGEISIDEPTRFVHWG